jgi:hypothetical protein
MNPFDDINGLDSMAKDRIKRLAEQHLSEELSIIEELKKEMEHRMARAKMSEFILSLIQE